MPALLILITIWHAFCFHFHMVLLDSRRFGFAFSYQIIQKPIYYNQIQLFCCLIFGNECYTKVMQMLFVKNPAPVALSCSPLTLALLFLGIQYLARFPCSIDTVRISFVFMVGLFGPFREMYCQHYNIKTF